MGGAKIIIKNGGRLVFKGRCSIASGCRINVNEGGLITFGKNVFFNANALLVSKTEINIGDDFIGGWNISLLDGDGHPIYNIEDNVQINKQKPIIIGQHCWLASHVVVLKGVSLSDNVIIPYGSILTKSCTSSYCIFGGIPNRLLKKNVKRND